MIDENEKLQEPVERWVSFYLGEERYAIEVKRVREILRIITIVPVPGAADHVLGITNIRGSVVTIIDGRRRINLPVQPQDDLSRMIVLEHFDEFVGVVVDSVSDVINLPVSAIDANPKLNTAEGSKYIKGVVTLNTELIIILDVDRLLGCEMDSAFAVGF